MLGQPDTPLFMALARETECCMGNFNPQDLASTAWAFAIVGQLDGTMVRVMSWEVFDWIRVYEANHQM